MRIPSPWRVTKAVYMAFDIIVLILLVILVRAFKPEIIMLRRMWARLRR